MTGTLALASAIATLDRDALARLVQARKPQAAAGVTDPIGLAAELLRPESITRALSPLDRTALRVLAAHDWQAATQITDRLRGLGLVGADTMPETADTPIPVPLPEVETALRSALATAGIEWDAFTAETAPPAAELVDEVADGVADGVASGLASGLNAAAPSSVGTESADTESAAAHTDGAWFTPALTSVGESAECLRALQRHGLRLNRSGAVGVAAARDLAERTAVAPGSVAHALRQLRHAGLSVAVGHQLVASAEAARWLALPHPSRWLVLSRAFLDTMPGPLRDSLAAEPGVADDAGSDSDSGSGSGSGNLSRAGAQLRARFPLLPDADLAAAHQFVLDAEHLGCSAQGQLTPIAQRLRSGAEVHESDVAQLLPRAATGVYLQPDLTVLAPGPLEPVAEAALAELTRPEQIGPASMRRVTEATLAAAFERGVSPEAARETFTRLSVTGLPQPLEYLLTSVADRVGRIVVHEHQGIEGRSRIRVAQPGLGETVIIDRQLQHLQLTRSHVPHPSDTVVLFSRLRPDHVVTAFGEARYHASLAGDATAFQTRAGSTPSSPSSSSTLASAAPDQAPAAASEAGPADPEQTQDPVEAMIERVFLAARTEPAAAAFTRRLELAIRDKTAVSVTAEARGKQHTFTLTPVALTDGRLRATDLLAGVERTLPVSMIVAVDPA